MTSFRAACVSCVYCVSVLCVCVCMNSGSAHHSEVPDDGTIQKQKLINQPVPELAPLSLVSFFTLSSLHPCTPPSLLLQHPWEEAEAAVTHLHQDSLRLSVTASLLYALSSPTYFQSLFNLPCCWQFLFKEKCLLGNFTSIISIDYITFFIVPLWCLV